MVVEIEYYKGDTLLYGTKVSFSEFVNQIKEIEKIYDREEDNFVALLCRLYSWNAANAAIEGAEYIYDRDIQKCLDHSGEIQKGSKNVSCEKINRIKEQRKGRV